MCIRDRNSTRPDELTVLVPGESGTVSAELSRLSPTRSRFNFFYRLNLSVINEFGTADISALNSLTADRYYFENGRTPEEMGFTLEFSDGATSPNLRGSGLSCDFDGDLVCDLSDLELLFVGMGNQNVDFDLDSDGQVDLDDRDEWLSIAGFTLGDSNLDGAVDSLDLNALGLSWQSDASSWAQGDFNGDRFVDSLDLNTIGLNWQVGVQAATVPEPCNFNWIVCLAVIALGRKRMRTQRLPCHHAAQTLQESKQDMQCN